MTRNKCDIYSYLVILSSLTVRTLFITAAAITAVVFISYGGAASPPRQASGPPLPASSSIVEALQSDALAGSMLSPDATEELSQVSFDGRAAQAKAFAQSLQGFPTDGSDYLLLSSGIAENTPGKATDFESIDVNGVSIPGGSPDGFDAFNVATLRITLSVPINAKFLKFDFKFCTEENPTFLGSPFQDYFTAFSNGNNLAQLPGSKPVTVDNATPVTNEVTGTSVDPEPPFPNPNDVAYNACTKVLLAKLDLRQVDTNQIKFALQIGDASDPFYDSAVFIDNLRFTSAEVELPEEVSNAEAQLYNNTRSYILQAEQAVKDTLEKSITNTASLLLGKATSDLTTSLADEFSKGIKRVSKVVNNTNVKNQAIDNFADDIAPKVSSFLSSATERPITSVTSQIFLILFKSSVVPDKTIFEAVLKRVDASHESFQVSIEKLSVAPSAPFSTIVLNMEKTSSFVDVKKRILDNFRDTFGKIQTSINAAEAAGSVISVGGGALCIGVAAATAGIAAAPCIATTQAIAKGIDLTVGAVSVGQLGFTLFHGYRATNTVKRLNSNFDQALQGSKEAIETGTLEAAQGEIVSDSFKAPDSIIAGGSGAFKVAFQNTGTVSLGEVQAILVIEGPGGNKRRIRSEQVSVPPKFTRQFQLNDIHPGGIGPTGLIKGALQGIKDLFANGTYKAHFEIIFGKQSANKRIVSKPKSFKKEGAAISAGKSVFSCVSKIISCVGLSGQQSSSSGEDKVKIIIPVKNTTDNVLKNVSVVDKVPKSIADNIDDIKFLTPPTNILNSDPKFEWIFVLQPGETKNLEYIVDVSDIGENKTIDFPSATVTATDPDSGNTIQLSSASTLKSVNNLVSAATFTPPKTLSRSAVQVKDHNFENKPIEPGAGDLMTASSLAALGSGAKVMKFTVQDTDPQADNSHDVKLTDIVVDNLGSADENDIAQIMVLDESGNAVGPPLTPTPGPHEKIPFRTTISPISFTVPDGEAEQFSIAVRTVNTGALSDNDQGNTVQLEVNFRYNEGNGSGRASVTDSAPEHIWNGGINASSDNLHAVTPLKPGSRGVVSKFTICDKDANEHNLVVDGLNVKQASQGTARHSDIVNLLLYRQNSDSRTLINSLTPTDKLNRGRAGIEMLPPEANVYISDDACKIFEVEAQASSSAYVGKAIQLAFQVSAEEPEDTNIFSAVDPQIVTNHATPIGQGAIQIPKTTILAGEPGQVAVNVVGVPLPGLGGLQVGPTGALQFNPEAIQVTDIVGIGDYAVTSQHIDNRTGHVRFTLRFTGGANATPLQTGTVARIKVNAVGNPGQRSRFNLTLDSAVTEDGTDLTASIGIDASSLQLTALGDVNGDLSVSITDSILLGNELLRDCEGLTNQQKVIADVADPQAATGDTPTCTGNSPTLDSSDVAQIAQLSLTSSASAIAPALEVQNLRLERSTADELAVTAWGHGVYRVSAELFDLSGYSLGKERSTGHRLALDLRASNGQPLANGVYLVAITVKGVNGDTHREIRKVAVLR